MKKLINATEDVVSESLAGFAAAHSDIVRIGEQAPFVQRRHPKPGKVALVSGGGCGLTGTLWSWMVPLVAGACRFASGGVGA